MTIRRMAYTDLPEVIPLAGQLGYPSSLEQLTERFERLSADMAHALLVADLDGSVVAFAHVHETSTLMSNRRAELNAIVVDETKRGMGIGKKLMLAIEEWVKSRGLEKLRLGSRTSRTDTHEFYKKIGFSVDKTWFVFAKTIG